MGNLFRCIFDMECNLTQLSFLSSCMKLNRKGFSSNSKYVVCFKKYFVGKGGLNVNSSCCVMCKLNWIVFIAIVKHFPVKIR